MLICVKKNIFLTSRILNHNLQTHKLAIFKTKSLFDRYLTYITIHYFNFISLKTIVENSENICFSDSNCKKYRVKIRK